MNMAVKQLIPAIASYVKEREAYLSKTKLLKLLYLFDVEYYRIHRNTFTGFQWKFLHLGPWTSEFDPLLTELETAGALVAEPSTRPEFDSTNYKPGEDVDLERLFANYQDENALKTVLHTWAERSTGEILDYVYFHTEPMERGIRNQPLDFSFISAQAPERYTRRPSGKSPGDIARLRRAYHDKQARLRTHGTESFAFTPPRYDHLFFEALAQFDQVSR